MTETNISEEKAPETASGFDEIKAETTKLFKLSGRAVAMTFQALTNRLLVHLDHETYRQLDLLVESGVAQDRHEAVLFLLSEGIKANRAIFEKVECANAQITSLQAQLRALDLEKETARI
jgi:hypothetical protein